MPREPKRDRKKTVTPPPAPKSRATVQPVGYEEPSSPPPGPAGIQPPNPLTHHVILDAGGHPNIEPFDTPLMRRGIIMDSDISDLECVYCDHAGGMHTHTGTSCAHYDCDCMRFVDPRYFRKNNQILPILDESIPDETIGDIIEKFIKGQATANQVRRAMGLEVHEENVEETTRSRILKKAEEIINGDRARVYGAPSISFNRIAEIWNAMGVRIGEKTEDIGQLRELKGADVALVLIGMKLSRTIGAHDHEDNWIDLAGYAGLGAELSEGEKDGH